MQTPPFKGHFAQVKIAFPSTAMLITPEMQTPSYSAKQTGFLVPLVPLQNLVDNADTRLPLTQDCQPPLIDSTTGHYNITGTYSTSLWSVFLASVQQGRALEHAFVVLNSTSKHCHIYQKCIGRL